MTHLAYNAASRAYFAFDPPPASHQQLTELRWQPHPQGAGRIWYSGSPYLAAPFWQWVQPGDAETVAALGPFAWNYWSSFAKEPLQGTGVDEIRLPYGSKPYPFQIAGVQRIMLRPRILLADQMGLGKTMEALAPINLLKPKRILIGCPAAAEEHWAVNVERWLVDPRSVTILGRGKRASPDVGVTICAYSKSHNHWEKILGGAPIDYLILDELHYLKSITARRAAPWIGPKALGVSASRVVALTGTPIPNNPLEIHNALALLSPETMGAVSREEFQSTYCSTFKGQAKVQRKGGGEVSVPFEKVTGRQEEALNAEMRASGLMVRRMTDDVLDQLPPKRVYLVHLSADAAIEELVKEEATLYDMLETKLLSSQELISLKGHIANVRARLGVLKAPKIAEFLYSLYEGGETHVVCFMLHVAAIEVIRKAFENSRIKVRVLSGAMNPKERQRQADEFQASNGLELTIGQIAAAGEIITLTAARYCVLGEMSWVPTANDQAIARVHRITQTRQTDAPICTFPYAVEERVLRSNAQKAISAQRILDRNLQAVVDSEFRQ